MDNRLFTLPLALIREHGTNDPFRIAACRKNTHVMEMDGKRQKGFCTRILNNDFIFINRNLSLPMQRMVCGHELAHLRLHRDRLGLDENGRPRRFVEWELFDIKDNTEYEANLFLANLLIDTETLRDLVYGGRDIVSIASELDVNVNLVALKVSAEKFDGITAPFTPGKNFLGRIGDYAGSY